MKTIKTIKKRGKWVRYKHPSRIEVFNAFASWMAYPPSLREPKTQGLFAKLHEISQNSLSAYKQKPQFWKIVEEKKDELKQDIELKQRIAEIFKGREYI